MKHLSTGEMSAFMDGALDDRARASAERHLEECASCRDALTELQVQDRGLSASLTHDPGEAYFESFASRVEERLNRPGQARDAAEPRRGGILGWFGSPRGMAWAGAAAALVVGAGIVFVSVDRRDVMQSVPPVKQIGRVEERAASGEKKAPASLAAPSADRAAAPSDAATHDEAAPLAEGAPSANPRFRGDLDGSAMSDKLEQKSAAGTETGTGAAPERTAQRDDAKSRAIRVQPGPGGENVKVPAPGATAFAPPPASAPSTQGKESRREVPAKPSPKPLEKKRAGADQEAVKSQVEVKENAALAPTPSNEAFDQVALDRAKGPMESLCGSVRDHQGRPVSGAQVSLADLAVGTATDRNGRYCLKAPVGTHTLSVLAIGFEGTRRQVEVGPGSSQADVALVPVTVLDGPVVRGGRSGMLEVAIPDTFGAWPAGARSQAKKATEESRRAEQAGTASAFETAASAWEQALKRTEGGEPELRARQEIADARYRAWVVAPNVKRKAAASEALQSYFLRAPAGAARDLAMQRMNQLGR